uniref:glycerol kinase n=1 Tax=Spongospora subterranea TaxID=70186 RepID=A0A0H5QNA4_9EUKA|eukprot:CRZ02851.1 hypothetical protein [Spongospora subterranea]
MSSTGNDRLVAAIDQGTSSTRCVLFNNIGEVVASHQKNVNIISHRSGWAEHDPLNTLSTVKECMQMVMNGRSRMEIACVGVTNQRETVVVWDKTTGQPLYNAILWLDDRTTGICTRLSRHVDGINRFRHICGLPISSYFSATKLIWLIENVDSVRTAVNNGNCFVGTMDSWIIWNLTGGPTKGVHITDVTNASRTMLMDIRTLRWSSETCSQMGIPESCLPNIVSNSEIVGHVDAGTALDGVPISGCLGDQHAAMIGQLCFEKGSVKTTYGTGAFMLLNTGSNIVVSQHGLLSTITAKLGPNEPVVYALEGSIAYAGALVNWLRDNFGLLTNAADISTLAGSVEDNGGVYFVPAFGGLFAPHWSDSARGIIIGLSQHTEKGHIARAALESICFSVKEVLAAMEIDSKCAIKTLRVDGGMTSSDTLMQMQAEVLRSRIERPNMLEATALGAAIAAGLSVGYWSSISDVKQKCQFAYSSFEPQLTSGGNYDEAFYQYQRAIKRSIGWLEDTAHKGESSINWGWAMLGTLSVGSAMIGAIIMRYISK